MTHVVFLSLCNSELHSHPIGVFSWKGEITQWLIFMCSHMQSFMKRNMLCFLMGLLDDIGNKINWS